MTITASGETSPTFTNSTRNNNLNNPLKLLIMQQRLSVALFGAPGSGKGTQAALIAEKYRFEHISTGELFRNEMAMETPLGL